MAKFLKVHYAIPCGLIGTILFACSSIYKSAQLSAYEQYYEATETLLDSLESRLNWMDATDPGPAYDNYIRARKKLQR